MSWNVRSRPFDGDWQGVPFAQPRHSCNRGRKRAPRSSWRSLLPALLLLFPAFLGLAQTDASEPLNILFVIYDDQSSYHTSISGSRAVETPGFDRVAAEGVRFTHAFTAAPSCTPSRSALLTGQPIWRIGPGGQLFGTLPREHVTFTEQLAEAGYVLGSTGKVWGPGRWEAGGKTEPPAGLPWNRARLDPRPVGMSSVDYARNFRAFLDARPEERPFFFWYGASEPHRAYRAGQGRDAGKDPQRLRAFEFFPQHGVVDDDLLDYLVEIEHADSHLVRMLDLLETRNLLDRTLVVVTSDHGMPFPRAKANLYDAGTRVPLAVRGPIVNEPGRVVTDFVSLVDLAPTMLEAAGIEPAAEMTGRSLVPQLRDHRSGRLDAERDSVVTAFERHTWCRPDGVGYPMRALRTDRYLYIRNYEPERWPAGDPDFESPHQGIFGDVDRSPTRTMLLENQGDPVLAPFFELSFGRRPPEELYDVQADPDQVRNLADRDEVQPVLTEMRARLEAILRETGDPRSRGENPWDDYTYYFGEFERR